jgi:hypothetical protein
MLLAPSFTQRGEWRCATGRATAHVIARRRLDSAVAHRHKNVAMCQSTPNTGVQKARHIHESGFQQCLYRHGTALPTAVVLFGRSFLARSPLPHRITQGREPDAKEASAEASQGASTRQISRPRPRQSPSRSTEAAVCIADRKSALARNSPIIRLNFYDNWEHR